MEAATFALAEIIEQHIQFCTTVDGVRIAYSMVGQGHFWLFLQAGVSHFTVAMGASIRT